MGYLTTDVVRESQRFLRVFVTNRFGDKRVVGREIRGDSVIGILAVLSLAKGLNETEVPKSILVDKIRRCFRAESDSTSNGNSEDRIGLRTREPVRDDEALWRALIDFLGENMEAHYHLARFLLVSHSFEADVTGWNEVVLKFFSCFYGFTSEFSGQVLGSTVPTTPLATNGATPAVPDNGQHWSVYLDEGVVARPWDLTRGSMIQNLENQTMYPGYWVREDSRNQPLVHPNRAAAPNKTFGANLILSGPPGTGKSRKVIDLAKKYVIEPSDIVKVCFHQEYSATDFIGSIKIERTMIEGRAVQHTPFKMGPMLVAIGKALAHPDRTIMLIIEEINRGSAGAIFGPFFASLDRDSEGKGVYTIPLDEQEISALQEFVTRLNRKITKIDELYLPSNLLIVATMNGKDSGTERMDLAFLRRWNQKYIRPDFTQIDDKLRVPTDENNSVSWKDLGPKLNQRLIDTGFNSENMYGQWYLEPEKNELKSLFYTTYVRENNAHDGQDLGDTVTLDREYIFGKLVYPIVQLIGNGVSYLNDIFDCPGSDSSIDKLHEVYVKQKRNIFHLTESVKKKVS